MKADTVHTHGGNCWCESCVYPDGQTDMLDVCMDHELPRGECTECKRCKVCDDEDTRTP